MKNMIKNSNKNKSKNPGYPMKICQNCGSKTSEVDSFCENCGFRLINDRKNRKQEKIISKTKKKVRFINK